MTRVAGDRQAARASDDDGASWAQAEQRLSDCFEHVRAQDLRLRTWVVRQPRRALQAARDLRSLPVLEVELTSSRDGLVLREALRRRVVAGIPLAVGGACVLPVPAAPDAYATATGASRQTLRRKARAAERAGVTCRLVEDEPERRRLQQLLDHRLTLKTDSRYRQEAMDSSYLLGGGLWAVAVDGDGEPLVLAVAPYDGAWALLECFVSLGETRAHSDARYLLTVRLVEELSRRGVRHLVDTRSALELTNGLRHFQRMLGFRIARLRLVRSSAGTTTDRTTASPPAIPRQTRAEPLPSRSGDATVTDGA